MVYCGLEVDRSGRAERGALSDRDADANSTDKAACIQRGERKNRRSPLLERSRRTLDLDLDWLLAATPG